MYITLWLEFHFAIITCTVEPLYCVCHWDSLNCPDLRGVLISECPDLRGFTVYHVHVHAHNYMYYALSNCYTIIIHTIKAN